MSQEGCFRRLISSFVLASIFYLFLFFLYWKRRRGNGVKGMEDEVDWKESQGHQFAYGWLVIIFKPSDIRTSTKDDVPTIHGQDDKLLSVSKAIKWHLEGTMTI